MKKITWPLILIVAGIILLFNNLGFLPWSIWITIWRLWPIILIFTGMELILPNSCRKKVLLVTTILIIIGLLLFLSFVWTKPNSIPQQSTWEKIAHWSRKSFPKTKKEEFIITDEDYPGLNERELRVNLSFGQLDLLDQQENPNLFQLKAQYQDPFGKPKIITDLDQEKNVSINFTNHQDGSFWPGKIIDKIGYQGFLGKTDLPTRLDLELGAGKINVDLADIQIKTINIKTGVGQLSLKLSENSLPQKELKINLGAGKVAVYLPEEVKIKVDYDLGVGKIILNEEEIQGLGKKGAFSSNQENNKNQIIISAQVGAGTLIINQ
jgi:hypothetical protein